MRDDESSALRAELRWAIRDDRVLAAIAAIPRERFVPRTLRDRAYENTALPIDCGQTISQPLVVARMLELLELHGSEHVLDVGTGSGYHAALLAALAADVVSVERHETLSRQAGETLAELGIDNVRLIVGDGSTGADGLGPFDAINVAAAVTGAVPQALVEQLAPGGRLVAPVGPDPFRPDEQQLVVLRREGGVVHERRFEPVRFVPLVPETGG
jgi:protein-L-isoaspartate(D-aspartate) O-methyltransferase